MTPAEAMVLATAMVLSVAVVTEGKGSPLNARAGAILLLLAILAAFVALVHMAAP